MASYEAIRYQKLDLLYVILRQIGAQIERMHLEDAVDVLINGDGNNNAAQISYVTERNRLTYEDLMIFWNSFEPYQLSTILINGDSMNKMLHINQIQNAFRLNTSGISELTIPMAVKVIRTSAVPDGKIVGLDKKYALERIRVGDVTVDYDKLIDRKFERSAITTISGFAKIFESASRVLVV